MTHAKPYRHRFPMTIIQHAVWLYHRFPLSYRDVQELLHQRGIQVSHETLREWCIKFVPLFAEDLRHREPRRGSRWHLDEVCTSVDGVRHWLWRAVDEYGFVLDILLQPHRDTEAAKTFLTRLLSEYYVPEVIHADQLRSYGAAIRKIPSLADVDHQVISTARCNNIIEQEHRSTRRQERSQQGFKKRKRAQDAGIPDSARPDHQSSPSFPHQRHRRHLKKQSEHSIPDVVNDRGKGGLNLRPPCPQR